MKSFILVFGVVAAMATPASALEPASPHPIAHKLLAAPSGELTNGWFCIIIRRCPSA